MKYPATHKVINPKASVEEIKDALAKQNMVAFTNEEFAAFVQKHIREAIQEGRKDGVLDGLRLAAEQRTIGDVKELYQKAKYQNFNTF